MFNCFKDEDREYLSYRMKDVGYLDLLHFHGSIKSKYLYIDSMTNEEIKEFKHNIRHETLCCLADLMGKGEVKVWRSLFRQGDLTAEELKEIKSDGKFQSQFHEVGKMIYGDPDFMIKDIEYLWNSYDNSFVEMMIYITLPDNFHFIKELKKMPNTSWLKNSDIPFVD